MADNNLMPWEEAQQSHAALYQSRYTATTKEQQNAIAPQEHQAFAREATAENPLMAVPIGLAAPIYQGAKALGLTNSRSDASVDQLTGAYKGIGEGLAIAVKKPWEEAQDAFKQATQRVQDVGNNILTSAKNLLPWEEAQQASSAIQGVARPKPLTTDGVFQNLIQQESKGQHTDASGNLTKSPAGALGITQILPTTAANPGFGITPLQNQSESEYLRVGKEYLGALVHNFNGDYEKALAAYNAGVGNVNKAITKAQDKGGSWKDYLPRKKETIPYINNILGIK